MVFSRVASLTTMLKRVFQNARSDDWFKSLKSGQYFDEALTKFKTMSSNPTKYYDEVAALLPVPC